MSAIPRHGSGLSGLRCRPAAASKLDGQPLSGNATQKLLLGGVSPYRRLVWRSRIGIVKPIDESLCLLASEPAPGLTLREPHRPAPRLESRDVRPSEEE